MADETVVIRELNDAEKKVLGARSKRLNEARRMLSAELASMQEILDVITGGEKDLAVDMKNQCIVQAAPAGGPA
jgi:hypothetical protein